VRGNSLVFLSLGHAYDHLFMLLYATVVLGLGGDFDLTYGERLALATPGFVAFGAGALPAGWLGDRWSRRNMLGIFFLGIGASTMLTGLATTPFELSAGLTAIGIFAAIYHPVGIAMVVEGRQTVGRALALNGVFGNMGVAVAAFVAGTLMDLAGWRAAMIVPGAVGLLTGLVYLAVTREEPGPHSTEATPHAIGSARGALARVAFVLLASAFLGGVIFEASTITLPKLFEERLAGFDVSLSQIGTICGVVFATAAFAQFAVGALIDSYPIKPIFVLLECSKVVVLVLVGLSSGVPALVMGFLMMLLVFGEIPISDTLVARHTAPQWRSRSYAAKNMVSLGVSAIAIPLVSVLHDAGDGFVSLFILLGACAGLSGAAALLLPGRGLPAQRSLAARIAQGSPRP
jgi:MFS family permease